MIKPNFTTLKQFKSILGITDFDNDVIYKNYIPIINDFLVGTNGYLNNEFLLDVKATQESTTEFIINSQKDFKLINCSNYDYDNYYDTCSPLRNIALGGVFVIDGQDNAEYTIQSIDYDNDKIITDTTPSILDDVILRIRSFPQGAKLSASQMVIYMSLKAGASSFGQSDVKSERIGDYNYSLQDGETIGAGGYPSKYLLALETYKALKFV